MRRNDAETETFETETIQPWFLLLQVTFTKQTVFCLHQIKLTR